MAQGWRRDPAQVLVTRHIDTVERGQCPRRPHERQLASEAIRAESDAELCRLFERRIRHLDAGETSARGNQTVADIVFTYDR